MNYFHQNEFGKMWLRISIISLYICFTLADNPENDATNQPGNTHVNREYIYECFRDGVNLNTSIIKSHENKACECWRNELNSRETKYNKLFDILVMKKQTGIVLNHKSDEIIDLFAKEFPTTIENELYKRINKIYMWAFCHFSLKCELNGMKIDLNDRKKIHDELAVLFQSFLSLYDEIKVDFIDLIKNSMHIKSKTLLAHLIYISKEYNIEKCINMFKDNQNDFIHVIDQHKQKVDFLSAAREDEKMQFDRILATMNPAPLVRQLAFRNYWPLYKRTNVHLFLISQRYKRSVDQINKDFLKLENLSEAQKNDIVGFEKLCHELGHYAGSLDYLQIFNYYSLKKCRVFDDLKTLIFYIENLHVLLNQIDRHSYRVSFILEYSEKFCVIFFNLLVSEIKKRTIQ